MRKGVIAGGLMTALATVTTALLVLLFIQPENLGFVREDTFNATATRFESDFAVFERTARAYDLAATRAFDLVLTVETERAALEATATENVAEQARIATAFAVTQRANIDAAFDNIAGRATLEHQIAVFDADSATAVQRFAATSTALADSGAEVSARLSDLNRREAEFAFNQTQVALDALATVTAVAIENEAQATAAALAFVGTQAAFEAEATRVEQAFAGTQAALAAEATAAAMGFDADADAAPFSADSFDAPTLTAVPFGTDGAFVAADGGRWRLDDATGWALNPDGTISTRADGAVIRSADEALRDYTLNLTIAPAVDGDYYALLRLPSAPDERGLALRVTYDERVVTGATIITYNAADLRDGGILGNGSGVLFSATPDAQTMLEIRVVVTGTRATIRLNDAVIFQTEIDGLNAASAVGWQLPAGARIGRLALNTP
ncbi:MAG: hypothetical protein EA396_02915 [Anaerolineaceae bacterium]|nr:MAG: hypothetical protein EA396_02915 [Anaerolineaceae bacterium]